MCVYIFFQSLIFLTGLLNTFEGKKKQKNNTFKLPFRKNESSDA